MGRKLLVILSVLLLDVLAVFATGCGKKDVPLEDAEVTLGKYTAIPVTVDDPQVTDTDVDNYMEALVANYAQSRRSDRTVVEDGDLLTVRISFWDSEGELLEGGEESEGTIEVGSGTTYEELEQGLVGKEVGQDYEIPIQLPDPYEYNEALSGQEILCKVTVDYIHDTSELTLAMLEDEDASGVLEGATSVSDLKAKARTLLEEQNEYAMRQQAYSEICSYLLSNCEVKPFPDAELAARVDRSMDSAREMCENYYGITFEEYLSQLGHTEEEYRADIESTVSDTLKLELIFTAIGDTEGIQYDEAEFTSYINEAVESSPLYETADDVYAEYGEEYLRRSFRIEYVVDWLIDQADLSYQIQAESVE